MRASGRIADVLKVALLLVALLLSALPLAATTLLNDSPE